MVRYSMVLLLMAVLACSSEKEEEPIPLLNGTIEPDHPEFSLSGDFSGYKAFAFDINDTFWMYISSNPNANCAAVSSYLNVGGERFDPVDVLAPGKCNMMVKLSDWQGSFFAENDPIAIASTVIECAMGEGVFELQNISGQGRDYLWTGFWWQGNPTEYRFDISGDRDDGYSLDIEMSVYNGGFSREEMQAYEAYGQVSGTMNAYVCEGLASTGL